MSMRLHADIDLRAVTLPFMEALRDKLGETDAGATADNRAGFIGSWQLAASG
ncbi:MAG: hypothetical protein V7731_07880 [Amphritea sp.]